ncbi:MAG: hypothetical protein PUB18_02770 [bacterium]|nr:hypothetical protein [bacterium]
MALDMIVSGSTKKRGENVKTRSLDLRYLIIKSDIEKALLEEFGQSISILTSNERIILAEYELENQDILDALREVMLDPEDENNSILLWKNVKKEILEECFDHNIKKYMELLEECFRMNLHEKNQSCNCLFFTKALIIK